MENKEELLKKKYADKSLSRAERHQAMEELYRERYKKDKRPVITLHDNSKIQCLMGLAAAVGMFSVPLMDAFGITEQSKAGIIIIAVLSVIIGAVLIYGMQKLLTHKLEPSDELSKLNELKSSELAFNVITAALVIGAVFYFGILGTDSLIVDGGNIYFLISGMYGLYYFISKGIFLKLDGGSYPDEEDE